MIGMELNHCTETESGIEKTELMRRKTRESIGTKMVKIKKQKKTYTSILFVPPTPGSGLLKEIKKREEELNKNKKERIKIVEKGGLKIEKILTTKNPFKEEKCQ